MKVVKKTEKVKLTVTLTQEEAEILLGILSIVDITNEAGEKVDQMMNALMDANISCFAYDANYNEESNLIEAEKV